MKRIIFSILFVLSAALSSIVLTHEASAAPVQGWDAGYIVSDQVFTDRNSMDVTAIQLFLNSKVPTCDTNGTQQSEMNNSGVPDYNSNGSIQRWEWGQAKHNQTTFVCLKDYSEGGKSAAQIIYDKAQLYQINPKVLIVLLQKEQSLVTDTWPLTIQYKTATGYGCPDTAPCDSQYFGLTNQLDWSAKMFRAIMNASPTWYTPYVVGNNFIQYNPQSSCGGTTVNIVNRSTQALYNYTPYQPNQSALDAGWGTGNSCGAYGNRNFYLYYQSWFGSPRGDYCITSLSTVSTGVLFGKDQPGQADRGKYMIYSGSGTGCIEVHNWQSGTRFGTWSSHIATNRSSANVTNSKIEYADLNGDGKDEAVFIGLRGTSSNKIEFHVWNEDLKSWNNHYISNFQTIDPDVSQVSFADLDGDGKDEAVLAGVMNGSTSTGKIEFHVWNAGFGTWRSHHVSNSLTIDPGVSQVSFADIDGDGKDEGVLVGLANGSTSTGKIEFHVWNAGFGTWRSHHVSNSLTIDPGVSQISFADIDKNKSDEAILVGLRGSGSGSGKIEFHVWNAGFGTWRSHHESNQSAN